MEYLQPACPGESLGRAKYQCESGQVYGIASVSKEAFDKVVA